MTLIFTNNNRLLFKLKSNNQLLELRYGNRFNALFDCKRLDKEPSTSYRVYLERDITTNFLINLKFDPFLAYAKPGLGVNKSCFKFPKTSFLPNNTKKTNVYTKSEICKRLNKCGKSISSLLPSGEPWLLNRFTQQEKGDYSKIKKQNKRSITQKRRSKQIVDSSASKTRLFKSLQIFDLIDFGEHQDQKAIYSKATLFDFVKNQDTASLALQSFSAIEILSLYGLLKNQPVLIQNFLKNSFSYVQDFAFNQSYISLKQSKQIFFKGELCIRTVLFDSKVRFLQENSIFQARSIKSSHALCNALSLSRKMSKTHFYRDFGGVSLKNNASRDARKSLLYKDCSLNKKEPILSNKHKTKSCKNSGIDRFRKKLVFVDSPQKLIVLFLMTDYLAFLKARVFTIKQFLPKIKIWGFALGSSFLFVSITSILLRQDQNRWLFTFSKNQMPGLFLSSQESSWSCFENITLKHLNRKNLGYKYPNAKALVKQIDCYNDSWSLSFSESWDQQVLQNYTAVFSKFFDKSSICVPLNTLFTLSPGHSPLQNIRTELCTNEKLFNKNKKASVDFRPVFANKDVKAISLVESPSKSRLFKGQENLELPNIKSLRLATMHFSSLTKHLSLKKIWLTQPWYQLHARIPPKRRDAISDSFYTSFVDENQSPKGGLSHRRSVRERLLSPQEGNVYKDLVNIENDSIPSKMSSSIRANNRDFIGLDFLQAPAKNVKLPSPVVSGKNNVRQAEDGKIYVSGENFVKRVVRDASSRLPHDRLKNLFYGASNFPIDTQVFLVMQNKATPESLQSSILIPKGASSSGQENRQEIDSLYDLSSSLKTKPFKSANKIYIAEGDLKGLQSKALYEDFTGAFNNKRNFEKVIGTKLFPFLQEKSFFQPQADVSIQDDKTYFDYPLNKVKKDVSQNEGLHLKNQSSYQSYQSYRHRLGVESNQKGYTNSSTVQSKPFAFSVHFPPYTRDTKSDASCFTNFSKSTEKISSYSLYKRNSISNRLMSGYKLPEIKELQLKKELQLARYNAFTNLVWHQKLRLQVGDLLAKGLHKTALFVSPSKNRLFKGKGFVRKWWLCRQNTIGLPKLSIKIPPAVPFYESKIKKWELILENEAFKSSSDSLFEFLSNGSSKDVKKCRSVFAELLKESLASTKLIRHNQLVNKRSQSSFLKKDPKIDQAFSEIRPLKKMPYRQLSLNEFQEVEPLFEQVNKSFRISPYHFTFRKSLFTDYNDYSSWSKDTPAAISIVPSLEEERAVENSWFTEQLLSKEQLTESKSLENRQTENGGLLETTRNQMEFNDSNLLAQEDTLSTVEDEDKKKEITKFEWLQQLREAEHLVEKRKDFQRLAYPNREVLFTKRLQVKPGMVHNLLVRDRKSSFFGITNLFPKRLVAQDQKQINSQILKEDQDRRTVLLFEETSFKNNDVDAIVSGGFNSKNDVFIEHLLKSGALYNLKKSDSLGFEKQKEGSFESSVRKPYQQKKEMLSSLRIGPRNRQKTDAVSGLEGRVATLGEALANKSEICKPRESSNSIISQKGAIFRTRQHPVYRANRRLRLRAPQLSLSSQTGNSQSRIDDLNLSQSHRWWQKRRTGSSLLGAPAKRYLVMPEIQAQDWRKIIEWQLKTYFLEEEKRVETLVLQKNRTQKADLSLRPSFLSKGLQSKAVHQQEEITKPSSKGKNTRSDSKESPYFDKAELCNSSNTHKLSNITQKENGETISRKQSFVNLPEQLFLDSIDSNQIKHLFKIKKIAIYLPWTTVKKSLKKPFEWPLTGLSYQSFGLQNIARNDRTKPFYFDFEMALKSENLLKSASLPEGGGGSATKSSTTESSLNLLQIKSFIKNKKPNLCYISSIAPHFKTSFLPLSNKIYKANKTIVPPTLGTDSPVNGLHENSVYKPFLFEARTENSYLLLHQLLLAVAIKQLFESIYKIFGKVITHKLKDSSLAVLLLPIFFNAHLRKNEISEFTHLKKRLKDLVGNEDNISSLSEIVWYLRNSCRGRMLPRGVVLVEKTSSESTDYLKAVGGEAQVPVIVQSLRALPFTQNHPQRRLEKVLTFAQKRAPCILFLDDLDSIGQSRTLLLQKASNSLTHSRTGSFSYPGALNLIAGSNIEALERKKWKLDKDALGYTKKTELCTNLSKTKICSVLGLKQCTRFCKRGSKSTQLHGYSSNLWSKPFDLSKTKKVEESNFLQLSETEKSVEQRRVDLMLRLLTVMDGITNLNGVLIVTTSKNPASLDPALLRPGRFEKLINLKLPNKKKRIELLKVETAKIGYTNSMPWEYFGGQTQNMTATEISSAVNHSAFRAIIQSTLHTFPTLEHGIHCVNGQGFSIQNLGRVLVPPLGQRVELETTLSGLKEKDISQQKLGIVFKEPICGMEEQKGYRRSALFLKTIAVHNPYKTIFNQMGKSSTRICASKTFSCTRRKKRVETSSQLAFSQAGKGVIHSSIASTMQRLKRFCLASSGSNLPNLLLFSLRQKQEQRFKQNYSARKIVLKKTNAFYNSSQSYFTKNLVRLYAGQASESLYLDSILCLRQKGFSHGFPQLSFLQSTFSSQERLQASPIIQRIESRFPFCPKTKKEISVKTMDVSKLDCLNLRNLFQKRVARRYNSFSSLRKHLQLYTNYEQTNLARFYSRDGKNFWWSEKVSETMKLFKESSGNWYRLYLPKIEQNKNNREWLLPDTFYNQRILLSKTEGLQEPRLLSEPLKKAQYSTFSLPKRLYNSPSNISTKSSFTSWKKRLARRGGQDTTPISFGKGYTARFSYYNMVCTAFYLAFQNCNENRELLDLLADHLIRFKIIRLHEVMRIAAFYF